MTMAAPKAHNSNQKLPDTTEALTAYAAFWKSSTIDLPLALMGESLRFMSHRLQAQADHIASLTRCRTVSEALETQTTFARAAVAEYAAEAGTIMQEARSVVTARQAA